MSSPSSASSSLNRYYRRPCDLVRPETENRGFELKLMHHYTALTASTLSDSKSQQYAWAVDIPAMAYDCPYLMDALLAVSALHLRTIHPCDRALRDASHSYMASAIMAYSRVLQQGISEDNAEALFSTAALIAFQSSAIRCFEPDCSDGNSEYNLPTGWFHSFQGIKTVVMASWPWLRKSLRVYPIIVGQPPLALNLDPGRHSFFGFLIDDLDDDMSCNDDHVCDETRRAYRHAVAFLDWAHRTPRRPHILGFAATVDKRFVQLISSQDPRALVIIACFFAMMKVVDKTWWLAGIARKEVQGIRSLVPRDWYPKLEWSTTVACWEGEMDEAVWGVPLDGLTSEDTPELGGQRSVIEHIDMLAHLMATAAPQVD